MKSLYVREYRESDVLLIDNEPLDGVSLNTLDAAFCLPGNPAFTVEGPEGEAVACFGIMTFWPGHGEPVLYPTRRIKGYAGLYGLLKRLLEYCVVKYDYKRLTVHIAEMDETGRRFVGKYGFNLEGRMPCYGPKGDDYAVYGRVLCRL